MNKAEQQLREQLQQAPQPQPHVDVDNIVRGNNAIIFMAQNVEQLTAAVVVLKRGNTALEAKLAETMGDLQVARAALDELKSPPPDPST